MSASIDYGEGPKPVEASILSLVTYEQEFGSDLIKDVFGKVELDDSAGDDATFVYDFGKTNWTALCRALWAFLRTADPSVPAFEEWARGVSGVNMHRVSREIFQLANDAFFRPQAAPASDREDGQPA